MSTPTRDIRRPEHLTDADELTHPIDPATLWSENYLSYVWSPSTQVGVYMHFNRPPFNPRLWHDIFIVYLPNDEFLLGKGFFPEDEPGVRGPRGAGLDWTCDEPWVQWTKRYEGAVQHVTGEELRNGGGALRDGVHTGAKMELVYREMGPVFGVGDLSQQEWANDHYEQHCTVTGWVEHEGTRYEIEGTGLRDHSWGPRDLSRLHQSTWLHAQFPSGRTFMSIRVSNTTGEGLLDNHVLTDDEGNIREVQLRTQPQILTDEEARQTYDLEYVEEDGSITTIRCEEILVACPVGLVGQSEMVYGVDDRPQTSHVDWECLARFEWDGEIGYGLSERLAPR